MLAGPKSGLTVLISTSGEAAAFAAAPIFSIIERVVFGLTRQMLIDLNVAAEIEMLDAFVLDEIR